MTTVTKRWQQIRRLRKHVDEIRVMLNELSGVQGFLPAHRDDLQIACEEIMQARQACYRIHTRLTDHFEGRPRRVGNIVTAQRPNRLHRRIAAR